MRNLWPAKLLPDKSAVIHRRSHCGPCSDHDDEMVDSRGTIPATEEVFDDPQASRELQKGLLLVMVRHNHNMRTALAKDAANSFQLRSAFDQPGRLAE